MSVFYSVDVETSGTDPFKFDLLTVGIQSVFSDGLFGPTFYERLAYDREVNWDPETWEWWTQQNGAAKREILSTSFPRQTPDQVADALLGFVTETGGDGFHDNVFVANPSAFDHAWIRKLFSETGVRNPFSYRVLCLRSAAWGAGDVSWWDTQRTHTPVIEHHALHDAQAQAMDLVDLIRGRR